MERLPKTHSFTHFISITFFYFMVMLSTHLPAQLEGMVTDSLNLPISGVSVYIKNSFVGTVTNNNGAFFLGKVPSKSGEIVFKSLGFKTVYRAYDLDAGPRYFKLSLEEQATALQEVTLTAQENPADAIIRQAIKKRKENLRKNQRFTANFYSKGVLSTKDLPKKIMGNEIDISDQALDSTRSGILYLSETYAKIFKDQNKFKEIITASKVSGDEQGITFNSASDAEFNFYQNSVNLENDLASPIGDNAFSFYQYRLKGTFYTDDGHLINRIEVKRKNNNSPTFEGIVYIVEDDWSFYGLELNIGQTQSSLSVLDKFSIKQNFNYDQQSKSWVKSDQVIRFELGFLSFSFFAVFSAVYTDYDFRPSFEKNTFGRMTFQINDDANKKDSLFVKTRPIPLTQRELANYTKKDSIVKTHQELSYLDSLDREINRFKWNDFLGKRIQNSKKETSYGFSFPLTRVHFNTVQGFNAALNLYYNRNRDKEKKSLKININNVYGFSDQTWYPKFQLRYLANSINYSSVNISIGKSLTQFDQVQPFSLLLNDIYSLTLKENYPKWYENTKFEVGYAGFIIPDIRISARLGHYIRNPRVNTSNTAFFNKDKNFQTNTPSNPDFDFQSHKINKYSISVQYKPQNQFLQYPKQRFYFQKENYPRFTLRLEQAFGSNITRYDLLKLDFTYDQKIDFGIKGYTFLKIKAGTFLKKESPAFSEMNHFHGNEILFAKTTPYLNQFNLLPYYQYSSSNNYFLFHWEHQFKKWGIGNWPLIRLLKSEFVTGIHGLSVQAQKPHFEVNLGLNRLGFGKFKVFRLDYFWALGKFRTSQGLRLSIGL